MQDVNGKVAFITGGSSGIGKGIARAFARAGMQVVVTGRRPEHLKEADAEFRDAGLPIDTMQVDVTDPEAMERAAEETERRHGKVHVLVNNAGIGLAGGTVAQAKPSDWDWVIDVNIKGVGYGLQAFLPRIQSHGEGGHIVNTSSMNALMPVTAGLYCMTKAAITALSETLHIELAGENIGVSAYLPGPVHSNIAAGPAARPDKYADSGYDAPPAGAVDFMLSQPYMSADEAGERVLQGVRRNDLFILTHPEFKDGVRDRNDTILNAFPDEPVNTERANAIPFLTSHQIYAPEYRLAPPTPPTA